MTARRIMMLLHLVTALALAGAVIACASPWLWPVREQGIVKAGGRAIHPPPSGAVLPPLSEFEAVLDRDFGRPLVKQPRPRPSTRPLTQAMPTTAPFRLIGTAVDSTLAVGIFVIGGGSVEVRGVGQKAGDADVIEVGATTAKLRHNGQFIHLSLSEVSSDSNAARADRTSRADEWVTLRETDALGKKAAEEELAAEEAEIEALLAEEEEADHGR